MRNDLIMIASADKNWGLGKDNRLLKRIPEDLGRFSSFTKGNLEGLFNVIKDYSGEVYVCGGETIYNQLLPYCKKALITQIDDAFEADAHLVDLEKSPKWIKISEGEWQQSRVGVNFRYVDYQRIE